MVAYNLHVIPHHVHKRVLHLSSKQLEIQGTLHYVAGIYQQHILFGATYAVNQRLAL